MHYLLFIISALAFLAGLVWLGAARSAIHEIQAFILFLIAAVCLSGAGVVEAVTRLRKATIDAPPRFIPGPGDARQEQR